ncbi:Uncharacterised protein [uncultured archaeon]|nr:Uncharacterised protein [uncultured archaeon]
MERDTAKHVWISELLSGSLIPKEDSPTEIMLKDGSTINRARIYGVAVSTNELVVDDSTGSILIRTFENAFDTKIGDTVLVIGRPRIYDNQCYILGEIVKKIDPKWLEIREKIHPRQDPISIIRALDTGEGADYQKVVNKIGEDKVIHLLSTGEIFETRPGKLRILE